MLCAQDMFYVQNILKLMGLKVKLIMLHEMDKKGVVELANNWTVGGHTRYVDAWQCYPWELEESKVIDISWTKGLENDSDAFTKNLDGPAIN